MQETRHKPFGECHVPNGDAVLVDHVSPVLIFWTHKDSGIHPKLRHIKSLIPLIVPRFVLHIVPPAPATTSM